MKKKVLITHQICSKCGQKKNINKFYKNINRKSGYNYSCKNCFMKTTKQSRDKRHKIRMQTDITYKLKRNLRRRTKLCISKKSASTQKLTGCTWKYLKQWLESQMTDTMTFDTVQVDHMMPLKSFDLTKPEEQRKACHYTNLQPMLPSENLSKGSKVIYDMRWNGQQWEINRSGTYLPRDKELI
jgi:hypothetical protein